MPRRTTKTKATSKKKAVKKPKKVQLKVRVAQKPEISAQGGSLPYGGQAASGRKSHKPEETKIESKKAVVVKEKIEKKQIQINKHTDPGKIEHNKRMVMWTGVIFFMVLIFGFWIFNLKNIFKSTPGADIDSSAVQEWDEIADEFSKTWEKVREGMAELKTIENAGDNAEDAEERDILSETATTSESIGQQDEIEELKKRLEELENKLENNEDQATSTPDM